MACINTIYARKIWKYTGYFINLRYKHSWRDRTFQPSMYYISLFLKCYFEESKLE